ncbi:RDD family protein [Halobaculum sp. MBLA0147]|uniref:RDD family protein n=1 Tax=Halobaculum sp. MBLA0147 TaxID=3079934 RepID=UPI003523E075
MVDLRLFGAIHTDRRGKVRSEFARAAEGVDAVFLEYPVDGFSVREAGRALARAPLATLGMLLASIVQWPLYALLVRGPAPAEVVAARAFADEHDLPVHAVDDHPITALADADRPVAVANWLALVGLVAVAPRGGLLALAAIPGVWLLGTAVGRLDRRLWSVATPALTLGVGWLAVVTETLSEPLVVGSVFALLITVVVTLEDRNEVMVDRIARHSDAGEYETVILTTGRAHLPGLRTAARDRGVTVVREYVPKLLRRGRLREPPTDEAAASVADPATAEDVLGRRVAAGVVDAVLVVALAASTSAAAGLLVFVRAGDATLLANVTTLVAGVVAFGYYTVTEARWGQTPGKSLFGLVVVDTEGRPIQTYAAGFRTILRVVDATTLYALVFLGVWPGRQRLGDRAADTLVARVDSDAETDAATDESVGPAGADDAGESDGAVAVDD